MQLVYLYYFTYQKNTIKTRVIILFLKGSIIESSVSFTQRLEISLFTLPLALSHRREKRFMYGVCLSVNFCTTCVVRSDSRRLIASLDNNLSLKAEKITDGYSRRVNSCSLQNLKLFENYSHGLLFDNSSRGVKF